MMTKLTTTIPALLGGLFFASLSSLVAEDRIEYLKQIKPVLTARCVACHGALKQEGGLRLDTAALAIKGGESGAAIQPGDAAASRLLKRVTAKEESERMPPEGEPLKPEQIEALRNWITQKAEAPADEQPERHPRDHWAFKVPVRPAVPNVQPPIENQKSKIKNPIDAFIAREHQQRGLVPQPEADKRVWLRRVSLDLIGLPPTVEELDAFLADQTPEAHDKVVTRLLDSPQYGQRWGRHWMDLWRYSDWWGLGAEVRNSQKHIWHWRDWIIESLNSDKGYDQMLREMLAADELYPNDLDRLRATGYLARQYFIFNRTSWLDETIEHTAKGMLGLTFNCAKCHDHKYDPLAQVEYYKLRAIFEPYQIRTEMVPGQTDFEKDGIPRAFDAHLDVPTHLHVRGDDRNPDKSRVMEPAVPAFLTSDELKLTIEPIALPPEATYPGLRDFVIKAHQDAADQQIAAARTVLEAAKRKLMEAEAAAKELAAKPVEPKPDVPEKDHTKPTDGKPTEALVRDDFASEKTDVWEKLTGQWSYANGRLIQSHAGANRAAMRLKQQPPADFEARLKYVVTGGDQWMSVGLSCDVTADGNELLAYVSAVAGGPRSQIAFKQNGNYVYPPLAAQARKVELNQPHEIVLRVRGTLLNMQVDGEHSVAFRLPDNVPRRRGFLEVITYDAKAEFVSFELRPLPSDLKLVDAATPSSKPATATAGPLPVDQAQLGVTIAEKALKSAEAQRASIDARAAADRAKVGWPGVPVTPAGQEQTMKEHAQAASKSERLLATARADEELSRAELALLQAASDKKAEAEKKLAAAKLVLETAQKGIDTPNETYTPLPGAKKTQEDYQNRNAGKPFLTISTGRRTAFAKWLTDPRNPLPARVAVNHIWMRHMGQPLVPTLFDFGRKGTPPTHPELLDWLAVELLEHNWSMKHIHRLIVTSQTYRLSSSSADSRSRSRETSGGDDRTLTSSATEIDPDNRFYWRMNPVRMEAQIVRDSLLHLAGELDVSLGGPSIAINDEASKRRSLYFVHSHNDHQKFLSTFDDASVLDCYRRAESIVPQQALALENSPLATAMSGKIAQRIATARPNASDSDFIRTAFLTILSLEPTTDELATTTDLLKRMTDLARAKNRPNPEAVARTNLVQTLINHNDFITIR
jgi:mono/diheme cytochrome c family protein